MPIDFSTALARLLRDGNLRDRFAEDPQSVIAELDLVTEDAGAIGALSPADLEYQAEILIRKRFDAIRSFLPMSLADLGSDAFPMFNRYARVVWPSGDLQRAFSDASAFASFLMKTGRLNRADEYRMNFLWSSRRWAVHLKSEACIRGRRRSGLQIFLRNRRGVLREWLVYFGF